MIKKILFTILLLFVFITNIFSLTYGGCEYSDISRLKSYISNINISYDYAIVNNKAYFDVTLSNIPKEVYFIDITTNIKYNYSNTNNGELVIKNYDGKSGQYKFYSNTSGCNDVYLGTKYYSFPTYNPYYESELCADILDYSICQKWANVNYSYEEFKTLIEKYKTKEENPIEEKTVVKYNKNFLDKIMDLYVEYYYFVLLGIILVCVVIIIINRRKNKFNL